jgi:transposase
VLYWQLTRMGVHCDVVAPTLVPVKAGDRVKTDRRDALKLARSYRSGDLTPVWVPDAEHEALRDLVRAREAAKKDQLKARHRLSKFLLRHGRRPPEGIRTWTQKHLEWVKRHVRFELPAQEETLVESRSGAVMVPGRVSPCCFRPFGSVSRSSGPSTPFPPPAHRTGRADVGIELGRARL